MSNNSAMAENPDQRSVLPAFSRDALDELYHRVNRPERIHPDPLEFLHLYSTPADIEIAGLIASSMAYGRVAQILKNVRRVLDALGDSPSDHIARASNRQLRGELDGIKHRFTTGRHIADMLALASDACAKYGSLKACFLKHFSAADDTVLSAVEGFIEDINPANGECFYLLPSPCRGSACKRMNLFLRWMARKDSIDPGVWSREVPPAKLVIPLDTHMHRIGLHYGLTKRKQADLKTALEITEGFRAISPDDPVKYDFSLTRFGILKNKEPL